jgi:hypothetical protein
MDAISGQECEELLSFCFSCLPLTQGCGLLFCESLGEVYDYLMK